MKVTVNYFGQLRQITQNNCHKVDCPAQTQLDRVLSDLAGRFDDRFKNMIFDRADHLRGSILISINGNMVDKSAPVVLHDEDDISLFPPIAGG